ncbi:mitochondrial inner-membrane-bound regulator-domain-containing protein [Mariannaea sp. PMI_226]|nr:mitochondrial inner-membrane-bound regulator-domain-containing protein [Mariannaea sp. PMI_226]
MISRAARASRICLACRTRLTQRSAPSTFRSLPIRDGYRQRRPFASDSEAKGIDIDAIIAKKFASLEVKPTDEDPERREVKPTDEDNKSADKFEFVDEFDRKLNQVVDKLDGKYVESEDKPSSSESSNPDFTFSDDILESTHPFESSRQQRVRKLRHRLLENAPLGVSALGMEADAILVKNPNKMRHDQRPTLEVDEKPVESSIENIDWSKLSPQNRVDEHTVTKEEVWNNINELRPDTKALRMKDYEKLSRALFNGFTTQQLRDYLREAPDEAGSPEINLGDYFWIAKQIPWAPFRTMQSTNLAYKSAYIHKLITQKWNVKIQDFVDDLGQTFIWIDPHYFPFLLRGQGGIILKTARKNYLDEANNEKLSTTSSECRINITSRKASTYAILERLDQYFKLVEDVMLPIGELTKTIPTLSDLNDLANITSTSLKLHGKGKAAVLQVSLVDTMKRDPLRLQNEGKADTVLRLLTTRPTRGLVEKVDFIPSLESTKGIFIGHNREKRSMAWNDKLRKWFRYVAPLGNSNDGAPSPLKLAKKVSLPKYTNDEVDSPNITTATFGHILHSHVSKSKAKISSANRIISPVIPHPAAFSALTPDNEEGSTQKTSIVLKFAPHVDRSTRLENVGPPVRLTIPITSEVMSYYHFKVPEESILETVVPWHVDDVILASQSVDARLVNQRHFHLDLNQPGIQEFLQVARFNLREGRLQTPKDVTLSVPENWQSAGSKGDKAPDTSISMLYDFRGIEIHQTLEMAWQNHTLRYSVIEAGQHGGKRQEISLQAGPPGAPLSDFKTKQRENFLKCVEDIATGKFWSWDEGFKLMKARQFEDFSYNLPEQELGDDFIVSEVDAEAEAAKEKEAHHVSWEASEEPAPEDGVYPAQQSDATPAAVDDRPKPSISEKDFFKHFSSRAGDQLDQFKASPKKRGGSKSQEEVLADDDPFKIRARPMGQASPSLGTEMGNKFAVKKDGDFDIFEHGTADDQYASEEWDEEDWYDEDMDNIDDIEDNELSTEEIEAELIKALGLENHPDQPPGAADALDEGAVVSEKALDNVPEPTNSSTSSSSAEAPPAETLTIKVEDASVDDKARESRE